MVTRRSFESSFKESTYLMEGGLIQDRSGDLLTLSLQQYKNTSSIKNDKNPILLFSSSLKPQPDDGIMKVKKITSAPIHYR